MHEGPAAFIGNAQIETPAAVAALARFDFPDMDPAGGSKARVNGHLREPYGQIACRVFAETRHSLQHSIHQCGM